MSLHPRTPVIIGVGQVTDRPSPGAAFASRPQPLDLMVSALERALADTGSTLARRVDEVVAVRSFTWHTVDPARLVAQRLGLTDVRTRLTPTGGNTPQALVGEYAQRILAGEIDAVAIVGAEAMHAGSLAKKEGVSRGWVRQEPDASLPPEEPEKVPLTSFEFENGLAMPTTVYPLFENARRARLGWTLQQQRDHLGKLWAAFAGVAATNPYAWLQSAPSADEITTPTASNRLVASPYTKMLVANASVDMGGAYVLSSVQRALDWGVSRDRMIFPQGGAEANDHWFVSDRPQLDDSPAMRAIVHSLRRNGVDPSNCAHVDLYSCFPTVVQTACDVLGRDAFDHHNPPTLTGGLTFGGGPGNNYVTHAICAMVERLRANPDDTGLVTGLGWFSTKHAWGTYAATPPSSFAWHNVQNEVDAQPTCSVREGDGEIDVETYTVTYARDGSAEKLIVAGRFVDGARTWCTSSDDDLIAYATTHELIGTKAQSSRGHFLASST